MTSDKSPLDRALDLFVYAPLAAVLDAGDVVPDLADRGRQTVAAAHMLGRYAVAEELPRRLAAVGGNARHLLTELGVIPRSWEPEATEAPAQPGPPAEREPASAPEPADGAGRDHSGPSPSADSLAIPGYDELAASQVIPRLSSLSQSELEAVGRYESATRGRRTILNRVAQLQSA